MRERGGIRAAARDTMSSYGNSHSRIESPRSVRGAVALRGAAHNRIARIRVGNVARYETSTERVRTSQTEPAASAAGQLSTEGAAGLVLDCWAAAWLGCWPDGVRPHSQPLRPKLHGQPCDQPRRPRPRL